MDKNHFDSYLGLSIIYQTEKEYSKCEKCIKSACKIEPRIKKGSAGLTLLEKLGYFWSNEEKKILHQIFVEMGIESEKHNDVISNKIEKATASKKKILKK